MQYINALLMSFLIFSSQLIFAEEDPLCQFKIAIELCCSPSNSWDAGFIAAKAAMETYKNDKEIVLILKEVMCRLLVSREYDKEIIEIAEDVIRESSIPLYIGAAWFQKSRISYYVGDYKKVLVYADIALNTLKREETVVPEGMVSTREVFEHLCHIEKRDAYERLNDKKGFEAECEILKTYKWLKED